MYPRPECKETTINDKRCIVHSPDVVLKTGYSEADINAPGLDSHDVL